MKLVIKLNVSCAGTESALSLLESCIKQVTPLSVSGDSQSVEGCGGGGERKDDRVMWGSELAALLSPTLNPTASPNTNTTTTPSKVLYMYTLQAHTYCPV